MNSFKLTTNFTLLKYNIKHDIKPASIKKAISEGLEVYAQSIELRKIKRNISRDEKV